MPVTTRYLFIASMDVDAEFEDLFNEVYDTEHIPFLLKVPGVHAINRLKGEPFNFAIGGAVKPMPVPSPVYSATYEIDGPEVLSSPEWAAAVERGRWPAEVRPHTRNRFHCLYRIM
jgi:hypothetical protein